MVLISAEETDGEVYSRRGLLTKHWAALTSHEAARVPGLCSAMDLLRGSLLSSPGPFLSTKLRVEAAARPPGCDFQGSLSTSTWECLRN